MLFVAVNVGQTNESCEEKKLMKAVTHNVSLGAVLIGKDGW